MSLNRKALAGLLLVAPLTACQDANKVALQVGASPPESAKLRSIETRRLEAENPSTLLASATATLQDLGYVVTESAPKAGVVVAAKQRDAEEAGQIIGQVALTIAMAALGVVNDPTWDKSQTIHVTFVTSPTDQRSTQKVRVSFDRYITNNHGVLSRTELITDPQVYNDFYARLSQGIALEKHS